jgi:hypothetical protein
MTNKDLILITIGMFYGMGIMLIAVNLGFFPIDGPSLFTGIVSTISAMIIFHFRDILYQKLGVKE